MPEGAEQPEIFKQSAGMRTTMWLSFNSETMSDLELTDYADRYLTDTFSTVEGVGRVRLGGQRELSLRVWLDPIALLQETYYSRSRKCIKKRKCRISSRKN